MAISNVNFMYVYSQLIKVYYRPKHAETFCEKCNDMPSCKNRTCGTAIPAITCDPCMHRSNQISYRGRRNN